MTSDKERMYELVKLEYKKYADKAMIEDPSLTREQAEKLVSGWAIHIKV